MKKHMMESARFVMERGRKSGNLKSADEKDSGRKTAGAMGKIKAPSKTMPMQIGRVGRMK